MIKNLTSNQRFGLTCLLILLMVWGAWLHQIYPVVAIVLVYLLWPHHSSKK